MTTRRAETVQRRQLADGLLTSLSRDMGALGAQIAALEKSLERVEALSSSTSSEFRREIRDIRDAIHDIQAKMAALTLRQAETEENPEPTAKEKDPEWTRWQIAMFVGVIIGAAVAIVGVVEVVRALVALFTGGP